MTFPLTTHDLAKALGGTVTGRNSVNAPGPGHSGRDRSMAVKIEDGAPEGFIVFPHAGDDPIACRDHVRRAAGLPGWKPNGSNGRSAASSVARMSARMQPHEAEAASEQDEAAIRRRFAQAMAIWNDASSPVGTLVETYLQSRGLVLPQSVIRSSALRFHPQCAFKTEAGELLRLPAMIGLMTDAVTGEPRAIHRTALKVDGGGKADNPGLGNPKKMLASAKGCVIRLCADEDVAGALGLTEGIENGIAVICSGWGAVWAAGTAVAVEGLPVLPGIESLTVFGDRGKAGEKAAKDCCQRWADAGHEAVARFPRTGDWNDIQRGGA